MMAGATSPARPWFRLSSSDQDLDRYQPVKIWLDDIAKGMNMVFQKSNTYRALHQVYEELGAFGTAATIVLPDYLIELYKRLKNDLPTFNDDPSWTLPMPARYVIGQDGTILYSEVNPDYTHRPEPDDMIPVLQRATAMTV